MKKYLFLAMIIFMASSCSIRDAYNTPFINSEDVVKLEFGMSKNSVLDAMPEPPLYVESGNSATSVWVYEVRTIKVRSTQLSNGTTRPNKESTKIKHQPKIDDLFLTFDANDGLIAWGPKPYNPDAKEVYYDCAGVCNGEAYLDECGECRGGGANSIIKANSQNGSQDGGSFKLELNVEGTEGADGVLKIEGGK